MVKEITIPENTTNKVHKADQMADSIHSLIQTMITDHASDMDDSFVRSPVFQGMLQQYSDAKAVFENAKNEIQQKFIPDEPGYSPANWNLNYLNSTLTIHYQKR